MPSVDTPTLVDLFVQIESCKNTKTKSELLGKVKSLIFNSMSAEQIKEFFGENSNFEQLFTLKVWTWSLEETSTTEFLEPYEIVERIFTSFDSLFDLIKRFKSKIIFLINQDQDEKVKHILIKHLIRFSQNLESNRSQNSSIESDVNDILISLIKQISNTTLTYSQLLAELIRVLCDAFYQLENDQKTFNTIFTHQVIEDIEKSSTKNSIIKFRNFEMIIKLATCSNDHLSNICQMKFNLNEKLHEYLTDATDILSKLNCVELLTDLATTRHGFDFLDRNNHLRILNENLKDANDFMVPCIVKLFSVIAKKMPEKVNQNYSEYFDFLFRNLLNDDIIKNTTSVKLALETFAFLFESNEMKVFISETYSDKFSQLLGKLIWFLQNSIYDDLRINSLFCIAELISPDASLLTIAYSMDSNWKTSQHAFEKNLIEMSHSFYERLTSQITHEAMFKICLNLAKKPFSELRLVAHSYFKALSQTKWGLSLLLNKETFVEDYLLNRSTENEKQGLESKFELIKLMIANLAVNTDLSLLVGEANLAKLNAYVAQGPFYSMSQSRVATSNV